MEVEAVACPHRNCVDLVVGDPSIDPIHLTAEQWREFAEAVKAGKYDDLTP